MGGERKGGKGKGGERRGVKIFQKVYINLCI